jgi:hypothetical protein
VRLLAQPRGARVDARESIVSGVFGLVHLWLTPLRARPSTHGVGTGRVIRPL